jgi:hypothetical protein
MQANSRENNGIVTFFNEKQRIDQPNRIFTAAEIYISMGWSVIPVSGKISLVKWSEFQRRRPSIDELRQWFTENDYISIAILTGRISQLAVLDFDDPKLYKLFKIKHPKLTETKIVKTNRGYHLYFHIPVHLSIQSRKGQGVDLQYEGRYVVAPPSEGYQFIRGGSPKKLTQSDINSINSLFSTQQICPLKKSLKPQNTVETFSEITKARIPETREKPQNRPTANSGGKITEKEIQYLYRNGANRGEGRNETLFRISLIGRDNRLDQEQVIEALADLHAAQPSRYDHHYENYDRRFRESIATIKSAFSRKPRKSLHKYKEPDQLSNAIREELLKCKMTFAVRTIEALRLKGIKPGQHITRKRAVGLLSGIVGRDSVDNALKTMVGEDKCLFERVLPSLSYPTPPNGVALENCQQTSIKCNMNTWSKSGKSKFAHRPEKIYTMPSNSDLIGKLSVRHSNISDELTLEDLKSAKSTRQTLHTELIKRKPGQYYVQSFATRLGMSKRTINRYSEQDPNIHSEPIFHSTPIYWNNLETVLPKNPDYLPHNGIFITDSTGKKYPPMREIARILLSKKQKATLRRRVSNYWWYGDAAKPMPFRFQADLITIEEEMACKQEKIRYFVFKRQPMVARKAVAETGVVPQNRQITQNTHYQPCRAAPQQPKKSVNYRKPLKNADDETFAQKLQQKLNAMSGEISISSARRLVYMYGQGEIKRTLSVMNKRKNINRPIGFMSTLLRSENKTIFG